MAEDPADAPDTDKDVGEERPRTGIRRRLGRLLNQRELAEDTREVVSGVLEMSDRAKTEAVRLVAREARTYLDELKIKEDILDLITSHSLELQLSVHLKPLADAARSKAPSEPEERPGKRAPVRRARAQAARPAAPTTSAEPDPEPDQPEAVTAAESEPDPPGKAEAEAPQAEPTDQD